MQNILDWVFAPFFSHEVYDMGLGIALTGSFFVLVIVSSFVIAASSIPAWFVDEEKEDVDPKAKKRLFIAIGVYITGATGHTILEAVFGDGAQAFRSILMSIVIVIAYLLPIWHNDEKKSNKAYTALAITLAIGFISAAIAGPSPASVFAEEAENNPNPAGLSKDRIAVMEHLLSHDLEAGVDVELVHTEEDMAVFKEVDSLMLYQVYFDGAKKFEITEIPFKDTLVNTVERFVSLNPFYDVVFK